MEHLRKSVHFLPYCRILLLKTATSTNILIKLDHRRFPTSVLIAIQKSEMTRLTEIIDWKPPLFPIKFCNVGTPVRKSSVFARNSFYDFARWNLLAKTPASAANTAQLWQH